MKFANMPISALDHRMFKNSYYPLTLINDIGFALLINNPWYDTSNQPWRDGRGNYKKAPAAALTQGKTRPRTKPAKKR
jgi:hypothetical protein